MLIALFDFIDYWTLDHMYFNAVDVKTKNVISIS